MSWFGRQLAKYLMGDIAIGGGLSVAGAISGAPAPANWTPTFSGAGSMTVASVSITTARYVRYGDLVWVSVMASMTLGGTANKDVLITVPVEENHSYQPLAAYVVDGGASMAGLARVDGGCIKVGRYDYANWTAAPTANQYVVVCGIYEAA